jgi:hypothetical protein
MMRNLASIKGAPLDGELAQQYADALPERARAFLDRLERENDQTRASCEAQLQACATYQVHLKEAEDRRDAFKRGAQDGDKEYIARLAVLGKRVTDARARLRAAESVARAPANIDPTEIMSHVFKAGLKEWRDLQVDPPELQEGETLENALQVLRTKIDVAQNRLRQIEVAILPLEEVQQAIDAEVARLVAAGEGYFDTLFMGSQAAEAANVPSNLDLSNGDAAQSLLFLKPELLLYCFRHQIADALKQAARLRFHGLEKRGCEVIPTAVRSQKVREAEGSLLALERQEAAILRGLDGERLALRRPDMNFKAALEIE